MSAVFQSLALLPSMPSSSCSNRHSAPGIGTDAPDFAEAEDMRATIATIQGEVFAVTPSTSLSASSSTLPADIGPLRFLAQHVGGARKDVAAHADGSGADTT
jgi:hypothetical protein